jgi:hypothetical protein
MGANDAAEMLEAAKAECIRLEQELARTAQPLTLGVYRNRLGAELTVTGPWMPAPSRSIFGMPAYPLTLGGIYNAESPPDVLGTMRYLVTRQSLADAGYDVDINVPPALAADTTTEGA